MLSGGISLVNKGERVPSRFSPGALVYDFTEPSHGGKNLVVYRRMDFELGRLYASNAQVSQHTHRKQSRTSLPFPSRNAKREIFPRKYL